MFFVLKKKTLIITAAVLAVIIAAVVIISCAHSASAGSDIAKKGLMVVIDAGHGGVDGGVSGVNTRVKESDLNLSVTKKLEKNFVNYGVDVTLTRKNQDGLYGLSSVNRKRHDMQKRKEIINGADPDIMISIHMNFFPQAKQRGAQVFYDKHNEESKALAETIQLFLGKNIPYCDRVIMPGEYYVLECTDKPAVIVECGFLSNSEDEALLVTAAYQEKLAYYIFCAAIAFMEY